MEVQKFIFFFPSSIVGAISDKKEEEESVCVSELFGKIE